VENTTSLLFRSCVSAPFHSNGSYSIVACVFLAAGMCLPTRCLAMDVYSDFTVPAFGRHVIVFSFSICYNLPRSMLSICSINATNITIARCHLYPFVLMHATDIGLLV
jgi:hypothetical protein